jgi:hypothetical protein
VIEVCQCFGGTCCVSPGTQFYVHHCVHLIGMIFWVMAPCNLVGSYQNFGGH